jgi:hypothetical protein
MSARFWAVLPWLVVCHAGCKACDAPPPPGTTAAESGAAPGASSAPVVDTAPAKEVVAEYFTAMATKDCAAIMPLVKAPDYTKEKCKEDVDEFEEHHTGLIRVLSAAPDGRDPKRILVTVLVRIGGKERQQIVGTIRDGDAWKVEKQ